ncbi:MAG: Hpt domain-containing protein, partial [Xanthomonadales bacterium]|nr:Hpt domain-containing protein [Xanthomonadales bacterium]
MMLLDASNVSTTLTWVRPDLDKHLTQIRTQIEHIASSTYIGDAVDNTAEHLTQLKFTFEALVLQGATLVVEEMITVCDELRRHNIRDRQKAYSALMDAVVVVPSYLDRLQAGHHDLPVLLLPVINELREAYNANIVSEATLFAPELDVALPELEPDEEHGPAFDEPFQEFALRMRRQWENALLRWLQHQQDAERLSPLHSVCETLQRRVERLDLKRLWWIAGEVIGGLLDKVTENDIHLRRLFARLHLIIKTLAEGGEDAVEEHSANAVSQALLFHIAQAKSGSASVDKLKERFQLQELVPDRDVLVRARGAVTGRNRELYLSLGSAVRDELSLVKDALDLELRTGTIETGRREQSHEALLRLQDTLKMMGLADSARSIEKLMPAFDASEDPEQDPDQRSRESLLMELAEQLIQVESVLEEQISTLGEPLPEDQSPIFTGLPGHELRRIRSHLLDETVVSLHQVQDAVRQYFEGDLDADYTTAMEHIAGALELIGEADTASQAIKLRNALANLLRVSRSEATIDPGKLEAVTDAVAALELYLAGCRDQQRNRERFLGILKERLERLPVGEMEVVEAVQAPAEEMTGTSAAGTTSELDPELTAVFLEEYEAVTGMLKEQLPRWQQDRENLGLLTEIRRGYHTLKGSGRMVGAVELGDYAWHVEALLNGVLETRVKAIDDVAIVLKLSQAVLPALRQRLLQEPTELDAGGLAAIEQNIDQLAHENAIDWAPLLETLPPFLAALLPGGETLQVEADDEPDLNELVRTELRTYLGLLKGLVEQISMDRSHSISDDQIHAAHSVAGTVGLNPLGREPEIAKALSDFLDIQRDSGMPFHDMAMWAVAAGVAQLESCLAIHEGDSDAELADDADQQIEQLRALTTEYKAAARQRTYEPTETEEAVTADEPIEEATEYEEETEHAEDKPEAEPIDTDIVDIFLEEATLILERCDSLLNTWRDNLPDLAIVQNLQREIHTFKGGARMAGLIALGDLSHSMETLLERIAGQLLPPSVSAIEALEQGCDQLNSWTESAGQGTV